VCTLVLSQFIYLCLKWFLVVLITYLYFIGWGSGHIDNYLTRVRQVLWLQITCDKLWDGIKYYIIHWWASKGLFRLAGLDQNPFFAYHKSLLRKGLTFQLLVVYGWCRKSLKNKGLTSWKCWKSHPKGLTKIICRFWGFFRNDFTNRCANKTCRNGNNQVRS